MHRVPFCSEKKPVVTIQILEKLIESPLQTSPEGPALRAAPAWSR